MSFAELFFDLVFVFAMTQLASYLAANATSEGLVRGLVLFVTVWWLWINTAWATNRLDPDRSLVRVVVFALMAAGLMVSISIPNAFGDRGLAFAGACVAMHVGRSAFMVWALVRHEDAQHATFLRVTIWFAVSAVPWIGGAFLEGDWRVLAWTLALAIDVGVPWLGFAVPGLGRSPTDAWDVEGKHLAERCGLFIIIALGELLLVTGARMADLEWDAGILLAFAVALLGSLVMWWIYFDTGVKRGTKAFEASDDPGRLARFAYTYVHLPIVGGIVVSAVGDKLLLDDPYGPADGWPALVILGGPALFLTGNFLFKNATGRRWPLSHVVGLGLVAAAWLLGRGFSTLALSAIAVAILVAVAILERFFLRSPTARRSGVN